MNFNTIKNYALAAAMTASPYAREAIALSKKHVREHADLAKHYAQRTSALASMPVVTEITADEASA
jgi:hypothetical protein